VSLDNAETFQQWKIGYPSVSTYDFAIQEREADLAIATFGRAMWVLDDIRPLRKLAKNKGEVTDFFISAPPSSINATFKNSSYEWSTWGMYDGENRPGGYPISVYLIDSLKRVKVQIKDANDKDIRNLTFRVDSGLTKNYWGYEQKGKRGAGMPKMGGASGFGGGRRMMMGPQAENNEDREYRGRAVLAGKYKVIVTANNKKDSIWLEVKDDVRVTNKTEIVKKQDEMMAKFQPSADKLNMVMDQLDEVDALLLQLTAEWKDKKERGLDTLNKTHKKVTASAKNLREFISGKKQEKQGYGTVDVITPMSTISAATMLIVRRNTMPGEQEEQKLKDAEAAIQSVVAKANEFFANEWAAFRKLVEATPIKKFKDYEVIK